MTYDPETPNSLETHAPAAPAAPPDEDRPNPALVNVLSMGSEGSKRTRLSRLRAAARALAGPSADPLELPWWTLDYDHMAGLRAVLVRRIEEGSLAPDTAKGTLTAVRQVLRVCVRQRRMTREAFDLATDLEPIRGERPRAGRDVPDEQVRKLFQVCRRSGMTGLRDLALFALIFGLGLRRGEAIRAARADYNRDTGDLRILGKGQKVRTIPLADTSTRRILDEWIDRSATFLHKRARVLEAEGRPDEAERLREFAQSGPILACVSKGGWVHAKRLSPSALYLRVRLRAKEAGIPRFMPHDGRRWLMSRMIDAGHLKQARDVAGHESMDTTVAYYRGGYEAARKALGKVGLPE